MARTVAGLPAGTRLSDYITLGVIAERIPRSTVENVLREEERESERTRKLPAHVVVYYVIALAIYMNVSYGEVLRCLLEGLEWLGQPITRLRRGASRPSPTPGRAWASSPCDGSTVSWSLRWRRIAHALSRDIQNSS